MARIFGIQGPDARTLLGRMGAAAAHGAAAAAGRLVRGDAEPDVALGVTDAYDRPRLFHADGVAVVLDGAIYNASAVGAGTFDAERIAGLYRRVGFEAAVRQVNGDFAVALYDESARTLWLARDRMGVKPLYYALSGGRFGFASRPRPLLALPGIDPSINARFAAVFAASHYRYFDNHPGESPFAYVSQLPGAHWLRLRDGKVTTGRYWTLEDRPDVKGTEGELAEQYRSLLMDAVRLRVAVAERPVFTLSGGMDSSSVLASAVRVVGERQPAISTVYADRTFDESDEIRSMLDDTVSQWHQVPVDSPDVLGTVARMVEAHDEPVATATWLSHFVLCDRAAALGFRSVFGGLGGDELNAGEYEHFFYHFADLRRTGQEAQLAREIEHWVRYHDHPIHRKDRRVAEGMISRATDPDRPGVCLPDTARMRRYFPALDPGYYDLTDFVPIMESPFSSYLKTRTFQDLTRETAPCCLRAEDRQTTAFGLDNFVPFFDHRLVEFMFRVPGALKIRDGVTKILLREAMRGVLPEETRTRIKKTGWNAPAHIWFAAAGRDLLRDLIDSAAFRQRGIYNITEVVRLADEHDRIVSSGELRDNHMMFFWQLVNLELWLRSVNRL